MVFAKLWAKVRGGGAEGVSESSSSVAQNQPSAQKAAVTAPVVHAIHDDEESIAVNPSAPVSSPPLKSPTASRQTSLDAAPLPGPQWGHLLALCYSILLGDNRSSINSFCSVYCPEQTRGFYEAWRMAGLQPFLELRIPIVDPRVQYGIHQVVMSKSDIYSKYIQYRVQQPRNLSPPAPKILLAKPRIRVDGPRGPYNRILKGSEWARYLRLCYEYHLSEDKPSILKFCKLHCPGRKRTFYTVWKKSCLAELLTRQLPWEHFIVRERLQEFIRTYDANLGRRGQQRRTVTKEDMLNSTPIGVAVSVQAKGKKMSALKIATDEFVVVEDGEAVKVNKATLLEEYKVLLPSGQASVVSSMEPSTEKV